jgi:phenylacetate-CoA ligase
VTDFYEPREAADPGEREAAFFARFAPFLAKALEAAPGLRRHIGDIGGRRVDSRHALAMLPVLRKDALMRLQADDPPFGGFAPASALRGTRVFASPGPIFEPQGPGPDPWGAARAVHAAGFRAGDIVVNAYSYHLTPGGFIMEEGALAAGCVVFPAGPGNSEAQAAAIAALRAVGYLGTPDFLKVLLDKAEERRSAGNTGGAASPCCRPMRRPTSGSSPMRRRMTARPATAWWSTRTSWWRSFGRAPATPCRTGRWGRWW